MGRPHDARVWNEDLLAALEARAAQCQALGKARQAMWTEAATAIRGVRQDIYAFRTGRIVGLPERKLTKTALDACRGIILGTEPILPRGYTPPDQYDNAKAGNSANGLANDHYLTHLKIRGGAFAILLAFQTQGPGAVLTRTELCRAAQRFCDEPMEADYMRGRPHGAWSAHKTLQRHQLLRAEMPRVQVAFRPDGRGGPQFRRALGSQASYALTDRGRQFLAALLAHRPEARRELEAHDLGLGASHSLHAGGGAFLGGDVALGGAAIGGAPWPPAFDDDAHGFGVPRVAPVASRRIKLTPLTDVRFAASRNGAEDAVELRAWAVNAAPGTALRFRVSHVRRRALHGLCDALNAEFLSALDRRLDHASGGAGQQRCLTVTMEALEAVTGGAFGSATVGDGVVLGGPGDAAGFDAMPTAVETIGTPPKRLRVSAQEAAGHAAMVRAAMAESSRLGRKPPPPARPQQPKPSLVTPLTAKAAPAATMGRTGPRPTHKTIAAALDGGDTTDTDDEWLHQTPALSRRTRSVPPTVLELSDSDDNSEGSKDKVPASARSQALFCVDDVNSHGAGTVIDLTDDRGTSHMATAAVAQRPLPHDGIPPQPQLRIYIDDRERNKNATPRHLRLELARILDNGLLQRVWPPHLPPALVEERQLARGDFAFEATIQGKTTAFPIALERKTVADLVQRSVSQAHWKQLCQMRDGFDICCFLIEGDWLTAAQHTAFGALEEDDGSFRPLSHKIDDAESLVRFVGRSFLSTPSFRLLQTEHEQGTLRLVAAFGLMSLYSYVICEKPPPTEVRQLCSQAAAKQDLRDRLQNGGIPWQLAKCIADEVGSARQLNSLYASAQTDECRDILLASLLAETVAGLAPLKGSPLMWSTAVHRVYFSPLADIGAGRKSFQDYQEIVADHARLLVNLHSGMSGQEALEQTLNETRSEDASEGVSRIVHIELPEALKGCLSELERGDETSAWNVSYAPYLSDATGLAKVSMTTRFGRFHSSRLCVYLLDGEEFLARILAEARDDGSRSHVALALATASTLYQACAASGTPAFGGSDQRVVLVRSLGTALGQAAKKPGYRAELPVWVDLVIAQLALAHGILVVRAARRSDDREMILRQLAVACLHFQPLLLQEAGTIP